MSKKQKRWKVSDIVRASIGRERGTFVAYEMIRFSMDGIRFERSLGLLNVTLPKACGVPEEVWLRMTHEQRCDALVATARRLNVPMNG